MPSRLRFRTSCLTRQMRDLTAPPPAHHTDQLPTIHGAHGGQTRPPQQCHNHCTVTVTFSLTHDMREGMRIQHPVIDIFSTCLQLILNPQQLW